MRGRNGTITMPVLNLLASSRQGMNARQIYVELIDIEDFQVLRTVLSTMVKRGFLYVDGKVQCEHCNAAGTCYRITDKGRYWRTYKMEGAA